MKRRVVDPIDVAIIGGGYSGIACALALTRRQPTLRIAIFDPAASLPAGIPFAAARPEHLLNVRAAQMSENADAPGDFSDYYQGFTQLDASAAANAFAPRAVYASYLQTRLQQGAAQASEQGGAITHQQALITRVSPQLRCYSQSHRWQAQHVILALGQSAQAPQVDDPRWFVGPWKLQQLPKHGESDHALVIGSGLSGVDSVLSLHKLGWRGQIHMLSNHARLPAVHIDPQPPWLLGNGFVQSAINPGMGLKVLRAELALAHASGVDWRAVHNALRPHTAAIFSGWGISARRQFLRRMQWLWTTHRHRMAPEVAAQVSALQASSTLQRHRGKMLAAHILDQDGASGIAVRAKMQGGVALPAQFACVIDARAPSADITRFALLRQLLADGIATACATGMALQCDSIGQLHGASGMYALGALRYGQLLETTAVPEIRLQARAIAERIVGKANPTG
jgi:uncharacterized NAD(P)/FAD-binding protein YdhS